jgi:DNA modification methylase
VGVSSNLFTVGKLIDTYHVWDARRIAGLLPKAVLVDVTITSPPYWNLKDYGIESQIGSGQNYERYLADLETVFKAVFARTKKTGSLWIISDTVKDRGELRLLPFDMDQRLRKIGWILQDIIIWNKDRTLPWSHQGKLRNIFEYITFYSKGKPFKYNLSRARDIQDLREWWVRYPERYSPQGRAPTRTWWIPIPRQGSWGKTWVRHFNPLPPQLVERILLLTTNRGSIVLDPFSGSGAVLAQAHVMGRRFIGLDLNPEYRKMFRNQVLPAIRKMHEQAADDAAEILRKKRVFRHNIRHLRLTKFPKEVVRLFKRKHKHQRFDGVVALSEGDSALRIVFLLKKGTKLRPDFITEVTKLSKRPPLSKYGITPSFEVVRIPVSSAALRKILCLNSDASLFAYLHGRTYAWALRLQAGQIPKMITDSNSSPRRRNQYPPIFSDIGIKLDRRAAIGLRGSTNGR